MAPSERPSIRRSADGTPIGEDGEPITEEEAAEQLRRSLDEAPPRRFSADGLPLDDDYDPSLTEEENALRASRGHRSARR